MRPIGQHEHQLDYLTAWLHELESKIEGHFKFHAQELPDVLKYQQACKDADAEYQACKDAGQKFVDSHFQYTALKEERDLLHRDLAALMADLHWIVEELSPGADVEQLLKEAHAARHEPH